jgi:hypothetical protein
VSRAYMEAKLGKVSAIQTHDENQTTSPKIEQIPS